jgi:hypothetical protein
LQQEAVALKAKEEQLKIEKEQKEAALAAAKAKNDADIKAKEKAVADQKAAEAVKAARDAQVAADAAAYAATPSGPAKDAIKERISENTKKAEDADKAIVVARNAVEAITKSVESNSKVITTLTDTIPKIVPQLTGLRTRYDEDVSKLKEDSPYINGISASIFRLSSEPYKMPDFSSLLKSSTSYTSTTLSTNIDFRDFSKSFVQDKYGFSTRFGATLSGFIHFPTSDNWHVFVESDDGSKVFIDGTLLVDNDGLHGMVEKKGTRYLKEGKHQFTVEFSQWDFGGGLVVRWMSSTLPKQVIPASAFYIVSPAAPASVVQQIQQINKDVLDIASLPVITGGSGSRLPPITILPQQRVDETALLLAQKAKELQLEQDRLAKIAAEAAAAKDARDKAAAATAQAAAAQKIADEMAKEEQRKKEEAERARIAADSKRIDDLKRAQAAADAALAEEKAAKDLADARFQQESRYSDAVAQRSAFYSGVADYAAYVDTMITGVSIDSVSDQTPLQCVQSCNQNPSCVAFTSAVQRTIVPGLVASYYRVALTKLPSSWKEMTVAHETIVSQINFPSGSVQADSRMSTNFAAVYAGYISIPSAGQWTFFISSDDGSKLSVLMLAFIFAFDSFVQLR